MHILGVIDMGRNVDPKIAIKSEPFKGDPGIVVKSKPFTGDPGFTNRNLSSQQFRVTGPGVRKKYPTGKQFNTYTKARKYANKKIKKTGQGHDVWHPSGSVMH